MKGVIILVAVISTILGVGIGKYLSRYDLLPDFGGPPIEDLITQKTASRVNEIQAFSPDADIAFIGDSITDRARLGEAFPGLVVVNRGVAGHAFPHMLRRIDDVLATDPELVFVLGGINGADFQKPLEAAQTFGAILDALADTNVVAQSALECRCDHLDYIRALNPLLEKEALRRHVTWLDLNDTMSDQNGLHPELSDDGIHLNGQGFRAWRDALLPLLP